MSCLEHPRSSLRECYPGAIACFDNDLGDRDALAVLAVAPTPMLGRKPSQATTVAALRRDGRKRNLDSRASEIRDALRAEQLGAPELVSASGIATSALVAVIGVFNAQVAALEEEFADHFEEHPDAEI